MFEVLMIGLICAILPMLGIILYRQGKQNGFIGDVKTQLFTFSKKINSCVRRLGKIEKKIGGMT